MGFGQITNNEHFQMAVVFAVNTISLWWWMNCMQFSLVWPKKKYVRLLCNFVAYFFNDLFHFRIQIAWQLSKVKAQANEIFVCCSKKKKPSRNETTMDEKKCYYLTERADVFLEIVIICMQPTAHQNTLTHHSIPFFIELLFFFCILCAFRSIFFSPLLFISFSFFSFVGGALQRHNAHAQRCVALHSNDAQTLVSNSLSMQPTIALHSVLRSVNSNGFQDIKKVPMNLYVRLVNTFFLPDSLQLPGFFLFRKLTHTQRRIHWKQTLLDPL